MTDNGKIIKNLLTAQQALAETVASGCLPDWEEGEFREMLHLIPCCIQRLEKNPDYRNPAHNVKAHSVCP